jgi:hypothetical protein
MPIYVDNVRIPYRGMLMSHMTADTLDEIHEMADKLKIFQKYFQYPPKTRFPHYDIPVDRRDMALAFGAHAVDRRSSLHYGAKLGIEWINTQNTIIHTERLIAGYERTIIRTQNYAIKTA